MDPAEAVVERLLTGARPEPGLKRGQDYAVTRQILLDCIGDRTASPRFIFFQCLNARCNRVRTTREIRRFPFCTCGSRRVQPLGGDINTRVAADALIGTIERERLEGQTNFTP